MGKVVYLMNVSLDGFVETPDHSLDWSNVDEELHAWFNDQIRDAGAFVYGRRLYEVMAGYWPTSESDPEATPAMLEFGRLWNPMPKVVFSTTLTRVEANSRLTRADVGTELERMRADFEGELQIGGPTLAAEFIRRDLVDEYRLVVHPVILGAGTTFFPNLEQPIGLRLVDTRTFASGVVYLRYERAST